MTHILLVLLTVAAPTSANQYDAYNHWKVRCQQLSAEYRKTLTVPFHPFERADAARCSDPRHEFEWDAEAANLDVLVANLFYYADLSVRLRALEMLEKYQCRNDSTCDDLEKALNAHLRATLNVLKPEFRRPTILRITALLNKIRQTPRSRPLGRPKAKVR